MKKLKKWRFLLKAQVNRKKNLNTLRQAGQPVVSAIVAAIDAVRANRFSPVEQGEFARMEQVRQALLQDATEVRYPIFGGVEGAPNTQPVRVEKVKDICRNAASPAKWSRFQFALVRHLQAAFLLELGTNLGISGSYLLAALHLNGQGRLVTCEGISAFAKIARGNFNKLGFTQYQVVDGLFSQTLDAALQAAGQVDYAFIDGHHDGPATIAYFEQIKPRLTENAVLLFDDINWSEGMQVAWAQIKQDPQVAVCLDFYKLGLVVFSRQGLAQKLAVDLAL